MQKRNRLNEFSLRELCVLCGLCVEKPCLYLHIQVRLYEIENLFMVWMSYSTSYVSKVHKHKLKYPIESKRYYVYIRVYTGGLHDRNESFQIGQQPGDPAAQELPVEFEHGPPQPDR